MGLLRGKERSGAGNRQGCSVVRGANKVFAFRYPLLALRPTLRSCLNPCFLVVVVVVLFSVTNPCSRQTKKKRSRRPSYSYPPPASAPEKSLALFLPLDAFPAPDKITAAVDWNDCALHLVQPGRMHPKLYQGWAKQGLSIWKQV